MKCLECDTDLNETECNFCSDCADKLFEEEEEDFLSGVTCNPDAPEECESCQ